MFSVQKKKLISSFCAPKNSLFKDGTGFENSEHFVPSKRKRCFKKLERKTSLQR
jgi:hypothetical protein